MANNNDEDSVCVNVTIMQPCKEAIAIVGKTQMRVPKCLKQTKNKKIETKKTTKTVKTAKTAKPAKTKASEKNLEKGE